MQADKSQSPPPYSASCTTPRVKGEYNETYFLQACRAGNLEALKHSAAIMAVSLDNLYRCGETGDNVTGLFLAAKSGHSEVCSYFNSKEVAVTDDEFLSLCVRKGTGTLLRLVKPRCDQVVLNKGLIAAIKKGHLENVHELLMMGASPGGLESTLNLPIKEAVKNGHQEIILLLLAQGANVNADFNPALPFTLLAMAVRFCSTEIVSLLLAHGANIHARISGMYNRSILELAVFNNKPEMVSLLLKNGANPCLPSITAESVDVWKHGERRYRTVTFYNPEVTVLSRAIELGHERVVDVLLASGQCDRDTLVRPNKRFVRSGESGLDESLFYTANAQLLRGSVRYSVEEGDTPLHIAVKKDNANMVIRLLQERAVVETIDTYKSTRSTGWFGKSQLTPLGCAAQSGNRVIVEALLARGANPAYARTSSFMGFIPCDDPPSPATLARNAGHREISEIIKKARQQKRKQVQLRMSTEN